MRQTNRDRVTQICCSESTEPNEGPNQNGNRSGLFPLENGNSTNPSKSRQVNMTDDFYLDPLTTPSLPPLPPPQHFSSLTTPSLDSPVLLTSTSPTSFSRLLHVCLFKLDTRRDKHKATFICATVPRATITLIHTRQLNGTFPSPCPLCSLAPSPPPSLPLLSTSHFPSTLLSYLFPLILAFFT